MLQCQFYQCRQTMQSTNLGTTEQNLPFRQGKFIPCLEPHFFKNCIYFSSTMKLCPTNIFIDMSSFFVSIKYDFAELRRLVFLLATTEQCFVLILNIFIQEHLNSSDSSHEIAVY